MCIRNNKWIKIHIHIHSLSESELSNQFENFIYFPMGLNYYRIMWCNLIERNEVNAFVNFVIHFCWICWHSLLCPFEDSYTYKSLKNDIFIRKKNRNKVKSTCLDTGIYQSFISLLILIVKLHHFVYFSTYRKFSCWQLIVNKRVRMLVDVINQIWPWWYWVESLLILFTLSFQTGNLPAFCWMRSEVCYLFLGCPWLSAF